MLIASSMPCRLCQESHDVVSYGSGGGLSDRELVDNRMQWRRDITNIGGVILGLC
jgi:hypothetical protein